MTKTGRNIRQAISIAVLLGAASAAAVADTSRDAGFESPNTTLCYCHCEHETGKPCTKMCELPQYKNRWWAASCHKKTQPWGCHEFSAFQFRIT